jgi:methionine-rich copper-binding protein CopC
MRMRMPIVSSALGAGNVPAWAHAFLDHASPLVGSTVGAAPHEVSLWFTQNLEPAFSSAQVTDAKGARVDQGTTIVAVAGHRRAPEEESAASPPDS